jgi:D-3-phosphoglycerate dehydrogenase / 2-oxoglutarate reductase
MSDAVAAIVSTDPFPEWVLAHARGLRVVARVGVGVDSIDVAAATDHGVLVTVTDGDNHRDVADHTLAMMLGLTRRLPENDASVRDGAWDRAGPLTPRSVRHLTVGLVGLGRIGQAVAERLRPFGCQVVATDPVWPADSPGVRPVGFDELIATSDVVSLHLPLTPATRGMFSRRVFDAMRPGSVFVNTSRGGLVDEAALVAALERGHLAGAGLDVFPDEPRFDRRLAKLSNVILTPHVAALSGASIEAMTRSATDSVLAVLRGEVPSTALNPQAAEAAAARRDAVPT